MLMRKNVNNDVSKDSPFVLLVLARLNVSENSLRFATLIRLISEEKLYARTFHAK